jgi:ATP-dependent HslUV protease subunit HslV
MICHNCTPHLHGTTVLAVRKLGKLVLVADGLMTLGSTRFKTDAKKLRKLTNNIICGYAGSVADCQTLMDYIEEQIEQYPTELMRASISLAKAWRTRQFSYLSANIIVCDPNLILNIDGHGNVIEIKDGVLGIGSGGIYAQSAAKALYDIDGMSAEDIALKAMKIAADLCIYTNSNFTTEILEYKL